MRTDPNGAIARRPLAALAALSLLATVSIRAQQQLVDPDFRAAVERPAYPNGGPTVAIDEAHDNFHTAGGQYAPFAALLGKGWVFDRSGGSDITTQLVFSRENGLLGTHRILDGRDPGEAVRSIRAFTGQSLTVPPGAAILMKFSTTAREAPTPDDLNAEDAVVQNAGAAGAHSSAVDGRAQGIALPLGKGRLVVLGEAALFSAQIIRTAEGDRRRDTKIGMNVPGNDDRQFALNVLHWLSGLLN